MFALYWLSAASLVGRAPCAPIVSSSRAAPSTATAPSQWSAAARPDIKATPATSPSAEPVSVTPDCLFLSQLHQEGLFVLPGHCFIHLPKQGRSHYQTLHYLAALTKPNQVLVTQSSWFSRSRGSCRYYIFRLDDLKKVAKNFYFNSGLKKDTGLKYLSSEINGSNTINKNFCPNPMYPKFYNRPIFGISGQFRSQRSEFQSL